MARELFGKGDRDAAAEQRSLRAGTLSFEALQQID